MTVQINIYEKLLKDILSDTALKAVLVVDEKGFLIEKAGNAMCVRETNDNDATAMVTKGLENVYIKTIGRQFVIVLFDEKMSFERIKASVDEHIARFLTEI